MRQATMMALRCRLALLIAVLVIACGGRAPATPATLVTATPTASPPTETAAPTPIAPTVEPGSEAMPADALRTLSSLVQVDDYPLYTMHYYGPYQPWQARVQEGSEWANAGAPAGGACSLFAALGDPGGRLYGRNFDWEFSPALLLFTDPADGYASVSIVDIAYLGFDGDRAWTATGLAVPERQSLLQAAWLPFDGMNEAGLAVGWAAVPPGNVQPDPAKPTLHSLGVVREMLDHAASVDEAVAIMLSHNIDFEGRLPLHYLVADRSGRAALVEFYDGSVHIFPNDQPWQQATNFLLAEAGEAAAGWCSRYDAMGQEMRDTQGKIAAADAMKLLESVAQPHTQWSVVYGMSSGQVSVVMGREYGAVHTFDLSSGAAVP